MESRELGSITRLETLRSLEPGSDNRLEAHRALENRCICNRNSLISGNLLTDTKQITTNLATPARCGVEREGFFPARYGMG